jgi:hypothetical protein
MSRTEFIRRLVLNEICDDYENVDRMILPQAVPAAARCGYTVGRADVVAALSGLVEGGLARAYILSPREPFVTELAEMPTLDEIEVNYRTYFFITPKGLAVHQADDSWWPYED